MGWVKARTTEMPAVVVPPRRTRTVIMLVGLLAVALVIAGVIGAPRVLRWLYPPAAGPQQANAAVTESPTLEIPAVPTPPETTDPAVTPSPTPTPTPTPAPTSTPKPATATHVTPTATPMPEFEDSVLTQTNAARAQAHCAPLRMDPKLLAVARLHSADMAQNNYFNHTSPDGRDPGQRMQAAGYDLSGGWAENIAVGYDSPDAVMQGWLASTGHKENILNCSFKALGVGVARGADGRLYWTQDFGGR
jgi:uncharacterized protein YkwD